MPEVEPVAYEGCAGTARIKVEFEDLDDNRHPVRYEDATAFDLWRAGYIPVDMATNFMDSFLEDCPVEVREKIQAFYDYLTDGPTEDGWPSAIEET